MTKIAFIGKFEQMHDEEYIARGFEMNGCAVVRIPSTLPSAEICLQVDAAAPDIVLWTKLKVDDPAGVVAHCKEYVTACWVFDLYFGYHREFHLSKHPAFKAQHVFTTDSGHDAEFKKLGINHKCVRQGIFNDECFLEPSEKPAGIVFVGTDNPYHPYRLKMIGAVKAAFQDFEWVGRGNPDEVRGTALNRLYATKKIVLGDSVYSPFYWSNRLVETLGRGGFLIHPEVEGLSEAYPFLETYKRGDFNQLKEKINYFLDHENERQEIVKKNFEFVKAHYTIDKKCARILAALK